MSAPELLATYFTLAGDVLPNAASCASPIPLGERLDAAQAAGFAGIGFNLDDAAVLRVRHGDAMLRRMLRDAGMRWIELEVLLDWFADGDRRVRADAARRAALEQAAALGAFQIKVAGDLAGDWPRNRMAEAFAILCDEAQAVGARITIELFPIANLHSIETGRQVVEMSGTRNGGLLFDIWHVVRGGISIDEVATLPPGLLNAVELDDGLLAAPIADIYEETIRCRLQPGEGEFDVAGLIRAARATGFDGPWGIEILSDENRALPVREAARRAADAMRRVLADAT